jgi:flagellar basal body-associated protein FliL
MKTKTIVIIVVAALVLFGAGWYFVSKNKTAKTPEAEV